MTQLNLLTPCVTPNGRTDGHMKYVRMKNGKMVCAFCAQDTISSASEPGHIPVK